MPAEDFYVYGGSQRPGRAPQLVWNTGVALRRRLTRGPGWLSQPLLRGLDRGIVPLLRRDADPKRFLDWTQRILRGRDTRIIHAYFGAVGWRLLAARRALGIPLVVTFLGDDVAPVLGRWWSWWIQSEHAEPPDWPARLAELLSASDLVLVEGPHMRSRLLERGCPADKIAIQRTAIPVSDIPFRVRGMPRGGRATILFAGRFCEQKGLLYALEAVRELWELRQDFEFRLVGDETMTDGTYAARVYQYIRRHRLGGCVRLLGFRNYPDYIAELDRADIFLHPSIVTDAGMSEGGAPTTILEAQAAGLPIVSTQHCDIPYVTVPGRSAILVPERDARSLARALGELLDAPETWGDYGRAGRAHVERYHDVDKEAPVLEDHYLALLDRAPRSERRPLEMLPREHHP
jgi:colanic acid/amylovoran biosynthesis glycosyltransferase